MKTLFLTAMLCLAPFALAAPACSKHSPAHTVALLELYTSEGCDSCPAADKFVSGLRNGSATGLNSDRLVPLSLHVDYWDYIGWKDSFAQHMFTERQRWLSNLANSRTVYTPEMFVAGQELRNWREGLFGGGLEAAVKRVNDRPALADIGIMLGKLNGDGLPVEVKASAAQGGNLFVALYENGLSTEVKAGENRGVTLRHDYVVRNMIGPLPLSGDAKSGRAGLARVLAVPGGANAKNLGVAAFVQSDKGEILQAMAMSLCGG
jgi:hypothetical protein